MNRIPTSAFWLGWAGVIPFAALTALIVVDGAQLPGINSLSAMTALVSYGAIILSFMGGVQWGLETARVEGQGATGFVASVLPALAAFAATFVDAFAALIILIAGFLLLLAYDKARIQAGIGPAWYGSLRLQLSSAVVLRLAVAAARLLS